MTSWDLDPPPWRPPSWWDIDCNVNDPSNLQLIRNAYAKAENCTECKNFSWPPEGVEHYIREWQLAAQKGCAGCMVLYSIAELIGHHIAKVYYAAVTELRFEIGSSRILVTSHNLPHCEVYSSSRIQDHVWKIPYLPQELQVSSYSGSAHAIKRTQLWLQQCEETHESCRHTSSPLPSRVLLILGPHHVKLYESNREKMPYACLSHCWGKKHLIRTTTSTLLRHKQSIPWKRLPLTFRQAVSFTYRLGLKYLWIDSLCIIQDDVEDWRNEGSRMAQTYSGAYITLAATVSRDASGGCFRHIPERPLFRLSYPDKHGFKLDLCIRPLTKNLMWSQGSSPLLVRAWTLQERLLSPRILHFTHGELVWECRTTTDCECSIPRPDNSVKNMCNSTWLSQRLTMDNDQVITDTWRCIVQQYSYQRLTYEKDIFPALQGISKMFSDYKKSRYLAGLWENSLIQDLSWAVRREPDARPKEWRAPSWSWASVLGPVHWQNDAESLPFISRAIFVAAEVNLASTDAFGEVLLGTITLRARCFPQSMQQSWIHLAEGPESKSATVYPSDPVWQAIFASFTVYPDYRASASDTKRPHSDVTGSGTCYKTVLLAQKFLSFFNGSWYPCLVLKKRDESTNTYERIAFASASVRGQHDAVVLPLDEEETLCIV